MSQHEKTVHLDPDDFKEYWGDFVLKRLLGRGGSGEVYLAHDPTLGRDVALKLGRPDQAKVEERLQTAIEEARILAAMRHPNIVTIFGAACHDSRIGFWMEYIDGADYANIVESQGPLSGPEAINVGMDVCRALSQVHGHGFIHRDIKAHNIVRETGGRTILMDFGTTAFQKRSEEMGESNIAGSPHFMPPEVFEGKPATPAYDIYSLGIVLFFLLSGELPNPWSFLHGGKSTQVGKRKRLRDFRDDLDIELIRVVEKASSHEIADRYQSAAEMETALYDLLQGPESDSIVEGATITGSSAKKRGRWQRQAIGLTLVLAVVVIALQLLPMGRGSLEVNANFLKKNSVGSSYSSIHDGDALNLGDVVRIELQCSEEIFVYVLNQDDRGNTFLLFPSSRWKTTNPLPGGTATLLPGETVDGRMTAGWEVNSVGGNEKFLLVASRNRLADFEKHLKSIPESGGSNGGSLALSLSPGHLADLSRGVGGVAFEEKKSLAVDDNLQALAKLVGDQTNKTTHNGDVWVGMINFRNTK